MTYSTIRFEEDGGVATLTLNRPAALNALTTELIEEMIDAVDRVRDAYEAGGTTRCLLLTGEGRAFCSGADLAVGGATGAGRAGPPDAGARLESHFNPLLERLFALPVPFITAVNGPAAGAGCSFALAGTSCSPASRLTSCRRSSISAWFPTSARHGCCRGWPGARERRR